MINITTVKKKKATSITNKTPPKFKARNGKIDLYKFIFSFVVMIYHYSYAVEYDNELFTKGYIAVEFFFVVSGFLFAKSLSKYEDVNNTLLKDSLKFSFNKYKSVFPYHIFACVITLVLTFFYHDWDFITLLSNLVNDIPNLLLFQMVGINKMQYDIHEWYISAMLIVMFILTPFIMKNHEKFTHYVAPIICFFSIGFLSNQYDVIDVVTKWTGFAYAGIIRAFGEISLGCFCFAIYDSGILRKLNKYFLMLVEFSIMAFTLIYSNNAINMKLDFTIVFLIAIGVTIAFSDQTSIKLLNNKFTYFLGKLSFAIYVNHYYARLIMINIDLSIGYIPQVIIL